MKKYRITEKHPELKKGLIVKQSDGGDMFNVSLTLNNNYAFNELEIKEALESGIIEEIKETPEFIVIGKKWLKVYLFDGQRGSIETEAFDGDVMQGFRIPEKAEIEAHKLGFHVGDEVWDNIKYAGKIKRFYYEPGELLVETNKKVNVSIVYLTKKKPINLVLGEHPVEIIKAQLSDKGLIICNSHSIRKSDWLKIYSQLKKLSEIPGIVSFCCMSYNIHYSYFDDSRQITIGTIKNITFEQIEKVTKALYDEKNRKLH